MAKAKFSRDGEGGYAAHYQVGNNEFSASFVKAGEGEKQWKVADGFAAGDRLWDKLRDLKADWAGLCESANTTAPPPTSSGPPALKAPPPLKAPQTGPPALKGPPTLRPAQPAPGPEATAEQANEPAGEVRTIGGKDIASSPAPQTRGEPCNPSGGDAHTFADPEKFAAFLHERGMLLGPCVDGGSNDFRCETCGAHVSDWQMVASEDRTRFIPPCRCAPLKGTASDYLPEWYDPLMWRLAAEGEVAHQHLTPLGALDCIHAWMRLNPDACTAKDKLVEPFRSVVETLRRETGYPEYNLDLWGKR